MYAFKPDADANPNAVSSCEMIENIGHPQWQLYHKSRGKGETGNMKRKTLP